MTDMISPLDWGPVSLIRRNHGLEHATINLLGEKYPGRSYAGHSDSKGFWVIGDISTDELAETVQQALTRLNAGEHNLAIHAHCGTNAVTTGIVAGTLAWLATLRNADSFRKKMDRWSWVVMLVTGGVILSQPLGPLVQEKVTTSGIPAGLKVIQIVRYERDLPNRPTTHRVQTRDTVAIAKESVSE
jgi:broad specificity phosphatase PhoE